MNIQQATDKQYNAILELTFFLRELLHNFNLTADVSRIVSSEPEGNLIYGNNNLKNCGCNAAVSFCCGRCIHFRYLKHRRYICQLVAEA